jgi:predicted RNA-binding Zn-ribbon protein involved in translation (DUF1610 family)
MGVNWRWAFYFVMISSGIIFLFSIWQIIYGKDALHLVLILYSCVFVSILILFLLSHFFAPGRKKRILTFEKTLKGGLYHFQCPHCQGIFAIKESMYVDKKSVLMTCPDCGYLARIPPMPPVIKAAIPQKKSGNVRFQCQQCGESLRIWAEGTTIHPGLKVLSCPFCGSKKPLKRI